MPEDSIRCHARVPLLCNYPTSPLPRLSRARFSGKPYLSLFVFGWRALLEAVMLMAQKKTAGKTTRQQDMALKNTITWIDWERFPRKISRLYSVSTPVLIQSQTNSSSQEYFFLYSQMILDFFSQLIVPTISIF